MIPDHTTSYISELSVLENVKEIPEDDWDKAGRITQGWLWEIVTCFNELGIKLIRSGNQQLILLLN